MECQADEIAELINDTLGITGVRAHALGAFNGTYFRVTISRFGASDARTYLVSIAASDLEHTNSTYMLNTALLPGARSPLTDPAPSSPRAPALWSSSRP